MRKNLSELSMPELEKKIKGEKLLLRFYLVLFVVASVAFIGLDLWLYCDITAESLAVLLMLAFPLLIQAVVLQECFNEKRFRLLEERVRILEEKLL